MFFVISGYLITSNARRRWGSLGAVDVRVLRVAYRAHRPVPAPAARARQRLAAAGVPIFQNHAPEGIAVSFWLVNLASLTFWMNVLIGAYGWVNYALGVVVAVGRRGVLPDVSAVVHRVAPRCAARHVLGGRRRDRAVYRFTHAGDEGGFLYAYFASFDGIAIGCCTALLAERLNGSGWPRHSCSGVAAAMAALLSGLYSIAESHVAGVTAMALGTAVPAIGAHVNGERVQAPACAAGPRRQAELRAVPVPPDRARRAAHVLAAVGHARRREAAVTDCASGVVGGAERGDRARLCDTARPLHQASRVAALNARVPTARASSASSAVAAGSPGEEEKSAAPGRIA